MPIKSGFIDKLIARLDRLDPGSLQTHFLRLAGEKGLLETIFHAIQEGVVVLDDNQCIIYANRAAGRLLGFNVESAENQSITRYLREINWDLLLNLDEGEWSRLVSREIEISYPEHRFIDFYVVPLSLVNEGEEGAVLIMRDVTRERENQEQTLESERLQAVTLLAAGVAHEIGNPLNSLNIHLQLLERELKQMTDKDCSSLAELVDISKQEVARLDKIIHQFLRAVRPTLPQFETSSINELLSEAVGFMKHEIENRGVWIETKCADDIPAVKVDRAQIKQAFYNLIKNAVDAMPDGGMLRISAYLKDQFVVIAFKDTGSGIKPEELGRIFEPYHTTKSKGSGLGLMIVQRIVREHGGEMEVDSRPDEGTTFMVYLPSKERRIRLLKAHRGGNDDETPEDSS